MFTNNDDRNNYYKFIKEHLKEDGIALILTMGDGVDEMISDSNSAWEDALRVHEETNQKMMIAATSCRIVNFNTLFSEIDKNFLEVIEHGITEIIPDFTTIMYVIIKIKKS